MSVTNGPPKFSKRRFGRMRNRFLSLCPYFAMFPESFAETWIERLTSPGQVVLDPFCGRGTTPFQAVLMNRRAIGVDARAST